MSSTGLLRLVAYMVLAVGISNGIERSNVQMSLHAGEKLQQKLTQTAQHKVKYSEFEVVLQRSQVDAIERASFLQKLKEVQASVFLPQDSSLEKNPEKNPENDPVFLAVEEVPLKQQVLNDKRLATYFGTISIGGSQQFKMLFDTGSCEFWVPGPECNKRTSKERCDKHANYQPSHSKTWKSFPNGQKLSISYLSGKVEGQLGTDTVRLGPLQVSQQCFGAADQIDVPLLDDVDWDGIVGLAYPNPKLTKEGVTPLFDNIMRHKLLQNNIFSYYLGNRQGAVTFGGVNDQYMKIPKQGFTYAKVTDKGYWSIQINDIELQYGSAPPTSTGVCKGKPNGRCKAIVDTGTYLIYGPAKDVKGTLGTIAVNSCEDLSKLPSVVFVLYAGPGAPPARLRLKPQDYTLEFHVPKDRSSLVDCGDPKVPQSQCSSDCVVGIAPDGSDPDWTLGQVFLKSFYTVFDRDLDRIGFARSNPDVAN